MKKVVKVCMCVLLMFACLACTKEEKIDSISVLTLSGPTGMSMAKMMEDAEHQQSGNEYHFQIMSAPDQITPEIIKGNYDIASLPVNLASVLYHKTNKKLQVVGINTLGVLYLLENGNSIQSIHDLKGKTIYATGQGANPEYVLRFVLEKNNIDPDQDVNIEFLSDHAELATKLKLNQVAIGMLPEPQVSVVTAQADTRIALNMNEEWDKVSSYELVQGCLVVRKEFAQKYPKALKQFIKEYKASIQYANQNVTEAAMLMEKYKILPKAKIAEKAIPNCNIVWMEKDTMHKTIQSMLQVLYEANPSSIGGSMPDEDFYYE